jgi:MFS superfamily sulfate permease-like transporter
VVLVGVKQGIILAMFLSLVSHTRHGYRPKNAVIVAARSGGWKTQPIHTQAQMLPGLLVYRFSHGMYYANATLLSEQVTKLVKRANPPLAWFCIDAAAVDDIDFSAAETLRHLYAILKAHRIRLVFSEVSDEVYDQLELSGIIDLVGRDAFYATGGLMISAYQESQKASQP